MPEDTCTHLVTLFQALGASLHLSPEGALTVRPAAVAHAYRPAITRHLCGLLVTAAVHEVQRLLMTQHLAQTSVRGMVSIAALNDACQAGDVVTTRAAAAAYVAAWTAWVRDGDEETIS